MASGRPPIGLGIQGIPKLSTPPDTSGPQPLNASSRFVSTSDIPQKPKPTSHRDHTHGDSSKSKVRRNVSDPGRRDQPNPAQPPLRPPRTGRPPLTRSSSGSGKWIGKIKSKVDNLVDGFVEKALDGRDPPRNGSRPVIAQDSRGTSRSSNRGHRLRVSNPFDAREIHHLGEAKAPLVDIARPRISHERPPLSATSARPPRPEDVGIEVGTVKASSEMSGRHGSHRRRRRRTSDEKRQIHKERKAARAAEEVAKVEAEIQSHRVISVDDRKAVHNPAYDPVPEHRPVPPPKDGIPRKTSRRDQDQRLAKTNDTRLNRGRPPTAPSPADTDFENNRPITQWPGPGGIGPTQQWPSNAAPKVPDVYKEPATEFNVNVFSQSKGKGKATLRDSSVFPRSSRLPSTVREYDRPSAPTPTQAADRYAFDSSGSEEDEPLTPKAYEENPTSPLDPFCDWCLHNSREPGTRACETCIRVGFDPKGRDNRPTRVRSPVSVLTKSPTRESCIPSPLHPQFGTPHEDRQESIVTLWPARTGSLPENQQRDDIYLSPRRAPDDFNDSGLGAGISSLRSRQKAARAQRPESREVIAQYSNLPGHFSPTPSAHAEPHTPSPNLKSHFSPDSDETSTRWSHSNHAPSLASNYPPTPTPTSKPPPTSTTKPGTLKLPFQNTSSAPNFLDTDPFASASEKRAPGAHIPSSQLDPHKSYSSIAGLNPWSAPRAPTRDGEARVPEVVSRDSGHFSSVKGRISTVSAGAEGWTWGYGDEDGGRGWSGSEGSVYSDRTVEREGRKGSAASREKGFGLGEFEWRQSSGNWEGWAEGEGWDKVLGSVYFPKKQWDRG
ncbi:MAG: hypothetical protein MMC23_009162 [Stictis urceolatum]|nr:hypothetical protein [Stictis urceolata]